MRKYISYLFTAIFFATSCVDHREDYMVDDSAYFAKSDLQEVTLSVMSAEDYVYNIWIHKSGYFQDEFAARLELDYNYMIQYNEQNGTDFEMLKSDYYSFERDFKIEKGINEIAIPITIKIEKLLSDYGYDKTFYIPLSVNSLTPGKDVNLEKSHFILALKLQQPVLKIEGSGLEDENGKYNGEIEIDMSSLDSYELNITPTLDVLSTEDLQVDYVVDKSLLEGNENLLPSEFYSYEPSVVILNGKQYVEAYLNIQKGSLPKGKYVIPLRMTTTNDKVKVSDGKDWLRIIIKNGELDDLQWEGDYVQGDEIIVSSASGTYTILNAEGRDLGIEIDDETIDWLTINYNGSRYEIIVQENTSTIKERTAVLTITDYETMLNRQIVVRQCMKDYGVVLNKKVWKLVAYSNNVSDKVSQADRLFDNLWPSGSADGTKYYVEFNNRINGDDPFVFTFYLGDTPRQYNHLGLMPRLQWSEPSPKTIMVEVSDDMTLWQTVIEKADNNAFEKNDLYFDDSWGDHWGGIIKWFKLSDENVNYKYIRLSVYRGWYQDTGRVICFDEIFVSDKN